MNLRVALVAQFAGMTAIVVVVTFLSKFLGGATDLLIWFVGVPLLALSALLAVAGTVWKPSQRRLLVFTSALATAVSTLLGLLPVGKFGDQLFLLTRRSHLEAFAREIRTYGRISRMSDGARFFVELNGDLVTDTRERVDTTRGAGMRSTLLVETVLQRDSIDRTHYDRFRRELLELRFIEFEAEPGYIAFLYDGVLDNLNGFLYVEPGTTPPALHSELFGADLISLEPIGGRWFRFSTT